MLALVVPPMRVGRDSRKEKMRKFDTAAAAAAATGCIYVALFESGNGQSNKVSVRQLNSIRTIIGCHCRHTCRDEFTRRSEYRHNEPPIWSRDTYRLPVVGRLIAFTSSANCADEAALGRMRNRRIGLISTPRDWSRGLPAGGTK